MVGRASTALRSEDEARQSARAELPRLADAIEDYGATADRERRKLVEDHALYQHRHAQAVRISRSLETLLEAPPPEQERRLRANKPAWKFFQEQPAGYRQLATWWVISAKRDETRARRLAKIIGESAAGRRAAW